MKLSQQQVSDRLVDMRLRRRTQNHRTGQVVEVGQGCMLGISKHAEDGTGLEFKIYPQHDNRATARRIQTMLLEAFADAENVGIEQPVGRIRAAQASTATPDDNTMVHAL